MCKIWLQNEKKSPEFNMLWVLFGLFLYVDDSCVVWMKKKATGIKKKAVVP